MIPRHAVEKTVDYSRNWPPEFRLLQDLSSDSSINYVVTGSLTILGNRVSIDLAVFDVLGQEKPRYFYTKAESMDQLANALAKTVDQILAYTERETRIKAIEVKGNTKTDSGAILRKISSKAGDRFDPGRIRQDLKNVFKMGSFDDVRVDVTTTEEGKIVTFLVDEKAVISQVVISGNKEMEEKEIKDVLTVSPNTILNTEEVQRSVENIRKLYKEKGLYETRVTARLEYPKPEKVNVRFEIKEGFKVYVKEILFEGNSFFSDKDLRKVISTSEKGWFSWITDSGKLKRDILEQDRARIGAYYHNHGFIEAKVGDPVVTRKGEAITVTFPIVEGDRYRVGSVDITGELIADKNDLFQKLKLPTEKFFSRQVLRDDVTRLTDAYAEKGYAYAEIRPRMNKNPEFKRMDVTFEIKKDLLVHVNRIIIKGNTRTRDKVIRREMLLKEGGIFNAIALRKSNERLTRLDYFEEVNINPEPTDRPELVDIVVQVKEKPTGSFSIGAGYSSVDHLSFMGEISQSNFLGKGQRMSLQASLSSAATRYNLSFTEPHLDDSKLLFGFDLYNWEREYDDYTKHSTGGAVRFGYPVWEKWQALWGYGYDDTSLSDIKPTASQTIKDSADINTTSYVKVGLARDTRNRHYDTSKGSVHNITVKHAGGILGGDSSFTKWEASTSWFFPWTEVYGLKEFSGEWLNDTTIHLKGVIGYAMENEDGKLPVYEKFYLGGINTVRGFDPGKISPKDPVTGERIGGEKMWYMNSEWIFPLSKELGLKGLVFFDAGNVYAESETWDLGELKKAVGVGFRWLSPMGPLRLEWGYNLDPAEDEDQGIWDFSIGGMF